MRPLGTVPLALFFVGLVVLEISHGVYRLDTIAELRRRELLTHVERSQAELAHALEAKLDEGQREALYLSRTPGTAGLLSPEPRPLASQVTDQAQLMAFVESFRDVERLSLVMPDGTERFRSERGPRGASVVPAGARGATTHVPRQLVAGLAEEEVLVRPLWIQSGDGGLERLVVELLCGVDRQGRRLGLLVLQVSGAPLLEAVRRFSPVEGVTADLVDARAEAGAGALPRGAAMPPPALADLLATGRAERDGTVLLSTPIGRERRLHAVVRVPEAVFEASMAADRGQHGLTVLGMVGITVVLGLACAYFLRMNARAFRLGETERYLERIRREGDKYRALMEGAADMILIVEPASGALRGANARARERLGAPSGLPAGGPPGPRPPTLGTVLDGAPLERVRDALRRAAAAPGTTAAVQDLRLRSAQGPEMEVDARLVAIDLGDERVVEVSLRDVTREREIERRLQTSDRLGSIGLLTAGVAHEINNPLEGIGNYLSMLRKEGLDEDRRRRYLERVTHGFERIRGIVGELLRFARPAVEPAEADLAQVVERGLAMAAYSEVFRGIQVIRTGLDRPLPVRGDPGRLEQVFLNLALNAAAALRRSPAEDGRLGRIHVSARRVGGAQGEPLVELLVEDEGPGIAPEDLGRIFDPFFTRAGGTGLGLAVSYGIVAAHGGSLVASNREGGGARFAMRLPAAAAEGSSQPRAGSASLLAGEAASPAGPRPAARSPE